MDEGFVKISRKLLDWEHADNLALTGFWIHLLLMANWEDRGKLKRGEFFTTIPILASTCGVSERTVKRYLAKLRESGEIKTTSDHKRTKVHINQWNRYQTGQIDPTAVPTAVPTGGPTADPTYLYKRSKEDKKERSNRESFVKPTLDELRAYIFENGFSVDPERFLDYYDSNGWKVGKSRMKDWKKAVNNWQRNEKPKKDLPAYLSKEAEPASAEELEAVRRMMRGE